ANILAELGVDIVLVSQPYVDEAQYVADLSRTAGATDLPLMVQDFDPSGGGVPVAAILAAYGGIDRFPYRQLETVEACAMGWLVREPTGGGMNVSGGWAGMQLIAALDRGVDAFMPTGLHRLYVEIFRRHRAGDRPGAVALFRAMLPILAFSN